MASQACGILMIQSLSSSALAKSSPRFLYDLSIGVIRLASPRLRMFRRCFGQTFIDCFDPLSRSVLEGLANCGLDR